MSKPSRKAVATIEPQPQEVRGEATAIIQVIERAAANPNVNIDKMERLLQMQKDILATSARQSYARALAQMQPELPVIVERGRIDIGRGKPQSYALWEDINDAIKPVLAQHGFAISFRTGREDGQIVVTGVLSHEDGHSEQTTIYLPTDTSGSKNAVQAVGSSTSYGKRYTASALLNLTSRGEDDDGRAGGASPCISEEQCDELIRLADEVGADKAKFCRYLTVDSFAAIPASMFERARQALESKRSKEAS